MAINRICTSQEQSQKLIKLGIDVNTADMYYDVNSYGIQGKPEVAVGKVWSKDIPAWSLTALLSVLPSVITREGKRMFLTLEKAGAYNLYYKSPDRLDELWETKEDVIDACVAMIENLHELKLLQLWKRKKQ